ncbi:MAG: hypothetical protein IKL32_03485 [Alphaproteobacteria bacterium]|nr:hypothetical protein [Alphaproteobacteria bacterium]
MFNKGKATLIAVLCSIAILISIMVMEWIFPFQNVVNIPLSSHASRFIGWKLVWLIPLCFLLHKNKPDGDDKKFKKILNIDIIAFLFFTEIGIPKFIYDIQKQRAKKEGITDVKKSYVLYPLSLFLYIAFMGLIVFVAIQSFKAEEYLDKLNKYISETGVLVSSERMECASRYQPEFVSTCSVSLTQKGAEISMRFNSYPYWLYDVEWNEGIHVKIDGYNVRFIFE